MSKGLQRSYVNAGGLFFFGDEVSSAFEEDVLSSCLFYQLGASVKHDKFSEAVAWRSFYLSAMSKFGHDLLRRQVETIPVAGEDGVWSLVRSELSKKVSPQLIERAEISLAQLQKHNSEASQILKANALRRTVADDRDSVPPAMQTPSAVPSPNPVSRVSSVCSLQLGFVDKEPLLTQVFVSFEASYPLADESCFQLLLQANVASNLELMTVTTELNSERYTSIREGIQEKLGARRSELVCRIEEAQS